MNRHLRTFYTITVTQVLSIIGSHMTHVALGIRVFNDTGQSAPLMLASFFGALPLMVGGSLAGVLADRWNRRLILAVTDAGQALGTTLLLISFLSGRFELWHLYAVSFISGTLGMLQRPAMDASVTMLVPDGHRDRANAIRQLTGPTAGIIAPVITGFVYGLVGVTGVMLVDLATFAMAVTVVLFIEIPQPVAHAADAPRPSVLADFRAGLAFLWDRRILLYLMLYAAVLNFFLAGPTNLTTPYILTLTGSKELLGVLLGVQSVGMFLGGVAMAIRGGTRPRIHGIMLGLLFRAVWILLYGLARTPITLGVCLFFSFAANALIDASLMSILQAKVPPTIQGRVFSVLFQMMYIANPASLLATGYLVDDLLEPAVGGAGWGLVAPLVGNSAGSGMGLLMVTAGLVMFITTAVVYTWPRARRMESDLPDGA